MTEETKNSGLRAAIILLIVAIISFPVVGLYRIARLPKQVYPENITLEDRNSFAGREYFILRDKKSGARILWWRDSMIVLPYANTNN